MGLLNSCALLMFAVVPLVMHIFCATIFEFSFAKRKGFPTVMSIEEQIRQFYVKITTLFH